MKILIWGCGSMSSSWALGLKDSGLVFICYNPTPSKAVELAQKLKGTVWSGQDFDAVVLGFKPQKLSEAENELKKIIKPDTLVISLLAGVKMTRLKSNFSSSVVRLMPNLLISTGSGVCLWSSTLGKEQNEFWQQKLNLLGFAPFMSEKEIDLYTLHAGCSPAFLFFLIQEMKTIAQENGGDSTLAAQILVQSLKGTIDGLKGDEDFEAMMNKVASKGGVTEATLKSWKDSSSFALGLRKGLQKISELS